MAEIKLIALDLDGTLLDSQKRLSSRNENALKECIKRGIWIVPCTGRIWFGVPEFIQNFPGIRYAITTNGAVIEDVAESQIIDEKKLDWKQAVELLELAKTFHTMYDAYTDGHAYGEARFMEHMDDYGIIPTLKKMILDTRECVPDVADMIRTLQKPVEKVNYFFGDLEERARARAVLEARGDVLISSSFTHNLEINALGAAKGEAVLRLAAHLGIAPEETMAFGDGENDLSMIRMTGVGVAMENAVDLLKAEADYVTVSNDDDGVALAIEKFALR